MKTKKFLTAMLLLVVSGLWYGCGLGLSGTYVNDDPWEGEKRITFLSGNKMRYTVQGVSVEFDYKKEGNKITTILEVQGMTQGFSLTINEDGCLDSAELGGPYRKE